MKKQKLCYPLTNLCLIFFAFSFLACDDTETEKQPIISADNIEFEINENPTAGQVLSTIDATTNFGELTFSILKENVPGSFDVTANGQLKAKDPLKFDYETNTTLTCEVLLKNGEAKDTVFATATIKNTTEVLEVENAAVSIPENSIENTLLAELSKYIVSDGDEFAYTIISLSVPNSITIDEDGKVWVDNKLMFDYEATPKIIAEIKVKSGALEQTLTLTIEVTNVFEANVSLLEELLELKLPPFEIYDDVVNYNLGYIFKVTEEKAFASSLGCAPTKDGDYTVTLYDVSTQQVVASIQVKVEGANSNSIKFYYAQLPQKIELVKDKEYAIAYYQEKGISFFRISSTNLALPNTNSGVILLKGAFGINNTFPSNNINVLRTYTADIKLSPL